MLSPRPSRETPLGPWLWLLCGLLAGWGPLTLALEGSGTLSSLTYGDAPKALALAARVGLTAVGVAAALALSRRHSVGLALVRIYLAGSVALALARAGTSAVPSTLAPSDEWMRFAVVLVHASAWWAYLWLSPRVRQVYREG